MIRSGELDRRITFESLAVTASPEYGDHNEAWTEEATVWAALLPMKGREFLDAAQVSAEITARFWVRFRSDIRTTWRISYNGQYFNIFRIQEIGRQEGLEIWATARED